MLNSKSQIKQDLILDSQIFNAEFKIMNKSSKIYVAGHNGMVGSAIVRILKSSGYHNFVLMDRRELDLTNQIEVFNFFERERPEFVFLAAAKVGGIKANSEKKADFIYDNLMIQSNIIKCSYEFGVKKLLFLGSSCIYPKFCPQPIKEEYLLSGFLEETNDAYSIAKISGIKMCQSFNQQYGTNFISVMPTNLYGPNDNYDLNSSHVLPALIRKFHEAKISKSEFVEIWGTGKPKREFLHVDDLAEACLFLMENYNSSEIINVGTGTDISIRELAEYIREVVNFEGEIRYNKKMLDGTPRKLLDVSKINEIQWKHRISVEEGIKMIYEDFISNFYQELN